MKLVFHSSTITLMHGPVNIRMNECLDYAYIYGPNTVHNSSYILHPKTEVEGRVRIVAVSVRKLQRFISLKQRTETFIAQRDFLKSEKSPNSTRAAAILNKTMTVIQEKFI